MNQSFEGRLETYAPGLGIIPSNLVSDTQYIIPGTYRRWMMAMRFQQTNKKGTYKFGFNVFKAKDDTNSVKFGIEPKDNLAGSIDLVTKFLKKKLTINMGVAASILTTDTRYGTPNQTYLDTNLRVKVGFDPSGYQRYIIINTSTVPLSGNGKQYLSYYTQVIYSNSFQYFNIEYRRNGGSFYSLGNPFLRNNYNGITVSERINLLKRKVSVGANYQHYSNNINETSAVTTKTRIFSLNSFINIDEKYPTLFISYMHQSRNSVSELTAFDNHNNRYSNFSASLNYSITSGTFKHSFRGLFNTNVTNDILHPDNKISFSNYSLGVSENFFKNYTVSVDAGKTLLKNAATDKLTDIFTYSLFGQVNIKGDKAYTSIGVSNNKNYATMFSNESSRMSLIFRAFYKFYKGMGFYLEAGSQPYREPVKVDNNYEEKYIYLRYTYDFDFK
jgi:hypothetical protein